MNGLHEYRFQLDQEFFSHFENSLIENGLIDVILTLDKHGDLMSLKLEITGSVQSVCDRCLAEIKLPIFRSFDVIVKRSPGDSDDPDLVYVSPEAHELDLAELLYEYACLAVPLKHSFDCAKMDPRPCHMEVLKHIQTEEGEKTPHPAWDVLKNIQNN